MLEHSFSINAIKKGLKDIKNRPIKDFNKEFKKEEVISKND